MRYFYHLLNSDSCWFYIMQYVRQTNCSFQTYNTSSWDTCTTFPRKATIFKWKLNLCKRKGACRLWYSLIKPPCPLESGGSLSSHFTVHISKWHSRTGTLTCLHSWNKYCNKCVTHLLWNRLNYENTDHENIDPFVVLQVIKASPSLSWNLTVALYTVHLWVCLFSKQTHKIENF